MCSYLQFNSSTKIKQKNASSFQKRGKAVTFRQRIIDRTCDKHKNMNEFRYNQMHQFCVWWDSE